MVQENLSQDIMVSIIMLAYNHEQFIRQALDSILMQEVNFKYQIIIGEDCSTDQTRAICLEYKEKHPDKIILVLHDTNVGMHANGNSLWPYCVGKYRSACEGDDYWIDPHKLQKQVDFLENNSEYFGTAHQVVVVNEHGEPRSGFKSHLMFCQDSVFTLEHAQKGLMVGQSASRLYRNNIFGNEETLKILTECTVNGDMKMSLYSALQGPSYIFEEVMAAHRWVTSQGDSWSAQMDQRNLNYMLYYSYKQLEKMALDLKKVQLDYHPLYKSFGLGALIQWFKKPNRNNWEIWAKIWQDYPYKMVLVGYILKRMFLFPHRWVRKETEWVGDRV